MKMFSLPVSDCGCFQAGLLGPDCFDVEEGEKPRPAFGIIVWYEGEDACRAALQASMDAHWFDKFDKDVAETVTAPAAPKSETSA